MKRPIVVNFFDKKYMRDPFQIRVNCPPLTLDEWFVLCDNLNGTLRADRIAEFLWHEVVDGNQEDYELNLKEFSERLKNFDLIQNLAILHAVDNYWKLTGLKIGFEEALLEAGANIEPA